MRRIFASLIIATMGVLGLSGVAHAETTPTTCLYQRYWTPECPGTWAVSIAQECKDTWANDPRLAASDPVCKRYAPKRVWRKYVKRTWHYSYKR